jgi:hypothetical protein
MGCVNRASFQSGLLKCNLVVRQKLATPWTHCYRTYAISRPIGMAASVAKRGDAASDVSARLHRSEVGIHGFTLSFCPPHKLLIWLRAELCSFTHKLLTLM